MDVGTAAVFVSVVAVFFGLWQMNNSLNERLDSFNARLDDLRRDLDKKIEREVDSVRRELSAHIDRNYNELLALRSVILGSKLSQDVVSSAYKEVVERSGGAGNGSDS
ncbi:hypothetical protein JCM16138_16180 [Thermococcus atlanticus]